MNDHDTNDPLLDLDALAAATSSLVYVSDGTRGGDKVALILNAAPTLIAAARDRDRWHDAAFAGQAHEAQLTAERDAAQAALDATVTTARNRLDEIHRLRDELETAQAALARVEGLLIEARSLIATAGSGREAQIVKDALATIRAVADERQEAGA